MTLDITDQVVSAPELIDESNGTVDDDGITNDTTPTFKGNAPAGSTVRVFVDGESLDQTATADESDEWEFTAENGLGEGTHEITYEFTPSEGGGTTSDRSDPLNITIDISGPVFDPPGPSISISKPEQSDTFVYQVSVTDPSGVKPLWLEGDDADAFTIDANGNVSLKETAVFTGSDDTYNFTVRAEDVPGNRSDQNVTLNILDSTGPVFTDPGPVFIDLDENSGPNAFIYKATASDLSTIQPLTLEGDDAAAFNLDADGNITFTNPDFENPTSFQGACLQFCGKLLMFWVIPATYRFS